MKKFLIITLFITSICANSSISSFSKSKKLLKKVYVSHQKTFYADCSYSYKNKKNMIDKSSCGYSPRNSFTKKGNVNKRAKRIEWEHVIPAQNFAKSFMCWKEGDDKCVKKNGKTYKGRRCCKKVSKDFKFMEADMHNLVPAIGELNADRSNFKFQLIKNEDRRYGKNIDFEVDFKNRIVEPKKDIRGNIARTYFYFEQRYGMRISSSQKKLLNVWNKSDKVDSWEREKNILIGKIQGNINPFIK
ncbi:MAG: endonuclease [Campylobacteraceae bacterium]|nr:endonuclease [Campylobacteraceae bacterium]